MDGSDCRGRTYSIDPALAADSVGVPFPIPDGVARACLFWDAGDRSIWIVTDIEALGSEFVASCLSHPDVRGVLDVGDSLKFSPSCYDVMLDDLTSLVSDLEGVPGELIRRRFQAIVPLLVSRDFCAFGHSGTSGDFASAISGVQAHMIDSDSRTPVDRLNSADEAVSPPRQVSNLGIFGPVKLHLS